MPELNFRENVFVEKKPSQLFFALKDNCFITFYLLILALVKYLHHLKLIAFPCDNLIITVFAIIACKIFLSKKVSTAEIGKNLNRVIAENKAE